MASTKIENWLQIIDKKKTKEEYLKKLREELKTIQKEKAFQEELKIYGALGNKLRYAIFKLLEQEALCTCVLAEVFGMNESSISHHLRILEEAGLIVGSKKGLYTAYYTKTNLIKELGKKG